ncbi:MAG: threonine--tRNA ligase [Endomicrobium sp.]|jgi:threonyl-tRNA synthetase|nr:threonine--tRNA ligase [Endomicrobium sp.]
MKKKESITINMLRHSAAHIMAAAVVEIFPDAKIAIGPPIENGFYYDFDKIKPFTDSDLLNIEIKMRDIISRDYKFIRLVIPKDEIIKEFKSKNEKYKIEIISKIEDSEISIYKFGNFMDLCKGPHINSTGELKYFKLLSVASAYWQGDSTKKQLQRIYGTAFFSEQELNNYLINIEEIKKRDHRKLGKELDLFSINEIMGSGLVLWHPNGTILRNVIENYWKNLHIKNGYNLVFTPHIASEKIFKISGHTENYSDNMYSSIKIDKNPYRIKPMNCPMHLMIYKTKLHSYKELPIKYAELATVYRFERSGVLQGLLRTRGFTQDDGHIIVTPDQLEKEISKVFVMAIDCLKIFGFYNYKIFFSTRPKKKYIGEIAYWEKAEKSLENALKNAGYFYNIDEGGGAFYGPKIDIKIEDVLGRLWQCSTIQFDFNLPSKFDITFINSLGKKNRPYMIHRALLGSLERFIAILLEHYSGILPFWLSPIQVVLINIDNRQYGYCQKLHQELQKNDIRIVFDGSNEKIGYKIRKYSSQKIPYIIVVGDKEKNDKSISVRIRGNKNLVNMSIDKFISIAKIRNLPGCD